MNCFGLLFKIWEMKCLSHTSRTIKQKMENLLKLSDEMGMGKDYSFVQITSMREETVEFCHKHSILVIVMFDSRVRANAFLPESPILLETEWHWITNNYTHSVVKSYPRSNCVSDELTFNPSDNDVAPDSPILLQMEWHWIIIH